MLSVSIADQSINRECDPISVYADILLINRTRLAMRAIVNAASEVSLFLYPFAADGARVMVGVLR